QGIEQNGGQGGRSQLAPFIMTVKKHDSRSSLMAVIVRMNHSWCRILTPGFVEGRLRQVPDVPFGKTSRRWGWSLANVKLGHVSNHGWTTWRLGEFGGVDCTGISLRSRIGVPIDGVDCIMQHENVRAGTLHLRQRGTMINRHLPINSVKIIGIQFPISRN